VVEQITTGIIIAGSALLFAYWFRYTCLLILSAKTVRDYAADLVQATGLRVVEVQSEVRADRTIDLAELHAALERDSCSSQRARLLTHNFPVSGLRNECKAVGSESAGRM
jgi:hypothetical protein